MTSELQPRPRLATVLTGLWAGSLLTICGVVAPTLFAALDERQVAGELAGRFFRIQTWLGAAIAVVLLGALAAQKARRTRRIDYVLIGLTAGGPVFSELMLRPIMDSARAAGEMARFGMLHGASALLFAAACVGALALLWRFSRPAG